MDPRIVTTSIALLCCAVPLRSQQAELTLDAVMARVAAYSAGYGEKASLFVAVEKYTQNFGVNRPRQIVAEFAIVKAPGGWVGYRDVVEVDGRQVADRRDRLLKILMDPSADSRLIRTLSDESARYNIGPISRNFNVPTTVLLLFQQANAARFTFRRSGTERVDGNETWKIDFSEVSTPTLTMTRSGRDVPMEGTLWAVPATGAVVRTRMRLRNFADATTTSQQAAPQERPAGTTTAPGTGRPAPTFDFSVRTIESSADFAVTYRWHPEFEMWLPATMTELYVGPIQLASGPPVSGRASTTATYSDFKQFQTGARINVPK